MRRKKRLLAVLLMAVMVITLLAVPAEAKSVKGGKATIYVGEVEQLAVFTSYGLKYTGKVRWSSSNRKVVSVTKKTGIIYGKKPGKATITAKFNGRTLKVRITVKKRK